MTSTILVYLKTIDKLAFNSCSRRVYGIDLEM